MNRLANESSPYLRQHKDNPVDWFPWGEEAFSEARANNRPVLLSVGYSACHWCHVMAHESFEDDATAKVMNALFVNVKVDREERPDVDAIYMEAVQAMSGQGGWPMTVFLTPDAKPFFAGTYFPKEPTQGHPGFVSVLQAVDHAWRNQHDELQDQALELQRAIAERTQTKASSLDVYAHGEQWLEEAHTSLRGVYDKEWGGFGQAPKFPQTGALELLLRRGDEESVSMVTNTLDAMASGGIYDHIGGGFSRYSVDSFWMVPHFEKMLYDQAALVRALTHTAQVTGEARFAQVAAETIDYVLHTMRAPGGAFYSAEDADSEGEEGKFYVWRPETIDAVLDDPELAAAVKNWYGVTANGNFEGSNILHRPPRGELARPENIERGRQLLFNARALRVRPGLDDKVLTEWNAMFIASLAEAAAVFDKPEWMQAATVAAEFLILNLRDEKGRWHRAWQEQTGAKHLAYANDYAWLVEAFTRLGEATGDSRWRAEAEFTADLMLKLFWDETEGGVFTTGNDAEALIVRAKDLFDGATASANSTAAMALLRLSALTENKVYLERAEGIIRLVADAMAHHPTAFTNFLAVVDNMVNDSTETVIVGLGDDVVTAVQGAYLPRNVLLWGDTDGSPLWDGRTEGAYVCRAQSCGPRSTTSAGTLAQFRTRPT